MAPALAEYASEKQGAFAWMLGRFIVPASRIPELLGELPAGQTLQLSVIIDAGSEARSWLSRVQSALSALGELRGSEPRLRIEALEVALPPLQTQRETYDAAIGQFAAALKQAEFETATAFVELPRDARWSGELGSAMFALARHRLGAKLRCGGVVPEAFPSVEEVAHFIAQAVREHRVPMKATAGLHHPIRHRADSLGVMMHGFLNVLAAAVFASDGLDAAELQRIVACEDARQFVLDERGFTWNVHHAGIEKLRTVRSQSFTAYGSCSFAEPLADLQHLGML